MSAEERSGWRDEELSLKHRDWGFNCPGIDIDFVMVEYNLGLPVALVDYKHHNAKKVNLSDANYRALCALADGYGDGGIPFLLAYYWPETWSFYVHPVNKLARDIYPPEKRMLSEKRFVKSLYYLRNRVLDEYLSATLRNDVLPADVTLPTVVEQP